MKKGKTKMKVKHRGEPQQPIRDTLIRKKFDKQWFLQQLTERGLSQRGFARALGVDAGGISVLFNGKRDLQIDEARTFERVLRVPVGEIMRRAGVELHDDHRTVDIRGTIGGDGGVSFVAAGSEDETDGPLDMPTTGFALQARTHHTAFAMFDRWLVYVTGVKVEPSTLLGHLVLCGLKDGKMLLGHIGRGYKNDTLNMHVGDSMRENVIAMWAMRVMWIRPADHINYVRPSSHGGDL